MVSLIPAIDLGSIQTINTSLIVQSGLNLEARSQHGVPGQLRSLRPVMHQLRGITKRSGPVWNATPWFGLTSSLYSLRKVSIGVVNVVQNSKVLMSI